MATLLSSAARTANGTQAISWKDAADLVGAAFFLDVTAAATAVDDTLNVYVQHSIDGTNYDDFVSFTQVLGNGGAKQFVAQWNALALPDDEEHALADGALAAGNVLHGPIGDTLRLKWTIVDAGADNASFTFSVSAKFMRDRSLLGSRG